MSESLPQGNIDGSYFDALFRVDDDPWKFRSRWYEQRKRAMTLACLPVPRYARGYEPGCANGELSAALASRCDRLLVSDGTDRALEVARERLRALEHVQVAKAWLPDDWPDASFDLIVLSELGYYLDARTLASMAGQMLASLAAGGTLLACHWRHQIDGCSLSGDDVHAVLDAHLDLPRWCSVVEPDFRIDVWCRDSGSVATGEGLLSEPQAQSGSLPVVLT